MKLFTGLPLLCKGKCWWNDGEECGTFTVQCCEEGTCKGSFLGGHECEEGKVICE